MSDRNRKICEELADGFIGHMALDSVVYYVYENVNKKYGTNFKGYEEALEFIQEHCPLVVEVAECPECGWFSEGNWCEHPYHDGVCEECEEVEEEEWD